MSDKNFQQSNFQQIKFSNNKKSNIIKSNQIEFLGSVKLDIDEDKNDGVKIILKRDSKDNIKEIRFVCSCGETKSIILDYPEE